ncbi:MAG: CBS domain-containing protein, partial [Pseudomonadota bacterium]
GRIVQSGTPTDIYTAPANDYVADFVAHMNPLGVLRALDVVEPGEGQTQVSADMPLADVMSCLTQDNAPLSVVDDGKVVGKITRRSVLQKLQMK